VFYCIALNIPSFVAPINNKPPFVTMAHHNFHKPELQAHRVFIFTKNILPYIFTCIHVNSIQNAPWRRQCRRPAFCNALLYPIFRTAANGMNLLQLIAAYIFFAAHSEDLKQMKRSRLYPAGLNAEGRHHASSCINEFNKTPRIIFFSNIND
jgi:hypothetical protein